MGRQEFGVTSLLPRAQCTQDRTSTRGTAPSCTTPGLCAPSPAQGVGISVTFPGGSPASSTAFCVAPTVQHLAPNPAGPPEHLLFSLFPLLPS